MRKRPLHRRISLHPASIMSLLLALVLLSGITAKVVADTYTVTGVVPAPPLTTATTIDQPNNGAVVHEQEIDVHGNCPVRSYVKLYINHSFSGVAFCASDGVYTITASLFNGTNDLLVQAYTVTNEAGPPTPQVQVFYQPDFTVSPATPKPAIQLTPGVAPTPQPAADPQNVPALPLILITDYKYQVFVAGHDFHWTVNAQGGVAPFTAHIQWGDNSSGTMRAADNKPFTIRHKYASAGYYPIRVTLTDSKGAASIIQLAALIRAENNSYIPGISAAPPQSGDVSPIAGIEQHAWLAAAWPVVGVAALMTGSFWLGERRELEALLRPTIHKKRHRGAHS